MSFNCICSSKFANNKYYVFLKKIILKITNKYSIKMKKTITILVAILLLGWTNLMATGIPSLSQMPYSFSFGNVLINTTATTQNFLISGTNLSNADIIVSAVAGLTYCATLGGTYTTTLTLSQPGGTYSQNVYVKFTPTLAQQYSGSISFNGGGNATAKTITISGKGVTIYYVKTTGSNSNDGSSWANAFQTLQKALETAQSGDQIWVASGTYKPANKNVAFQMLEGVEIYGGFAGTETAITDRSNFGIGKANETILSGDINGNDNYSAPNFLWSGDNCQHVIYNSGTPVLTAAAVLDGFTIKGAYGSQFGGGIYNNGVSPTFRNCIITNNHCYVGGGGIFNWGPPTCNPTFSNCLIVNNSAGYGAGAWSRAASPTFINTTFANNTADYASAYWSGMGGTATFNNCILWGNNGGVSTDPSNSKQIWSDGVVNLNYSCYSNGTNDNTGTINASNCITNDPLLMNTSKNDFRIVGLSPCLDAGNDTYNSLTTDIRGKGFGRKLLKTDSTTIGTIDMGAYEYKNGLDSINPCTAAVISSQSTATQSQCLNGAFTPISITTTSTGNVLNYKWYSNSSADTNSGTIIDTISNSYTPLATTTGTLYYYCKVSGDCGASKNSAISGAIITNTPTTINSQSTATQTQCYGGIFSSISVSASGDNLSYQWYKNTNSSNSGGSSLSSNNGAQTDTYTPQSYASGILYYYCVITGSCGSDTTAISGAFITNSKPVPTLSGADTACNNTIGNIYTTESSMTNYNWVVTGGTITNGSGTNTITITWNTVGPQSISIDYSTIFGCNTEITTKNIIIGDAPTPLITGSPNDGYYVHCTNVITYCTPYVAGHLYSWSGFGSVTVTNPAQGNCIEDTFINPCGVYGAWPIIVTETDPTTGCSTTYTKNVYIQTN